ncbi:hypothetical protein RRG08_020409 [Elysia crispata]|uniref:Uncharacterized protein n=1 Tax=Elysia crispata TaxID=231223 RepID=A0AAE1B4E7_9GAST|nr:hypothetical protein RRG08_020409 [Elysia crispata]
MFLLRGIQVVGVGLDVRARIGHSDDIKILIRSYHLRYPGIQVVGSGLNVRARIGRSDDIKILTTSSRGERPHALITTICGTGNIVRRLLVPALPLPDGGSRVKSSFDIDLIGIRTNGPAW